MKDLKLIIQPLGSSLVTQQLRIWHCHYCGSSLILGLGTSVCHEGGQKKGKKLTILIKLNPFLNVPYTLRFFFPHKNI